MEKIHQKYNVSIESDADYYKGKIVIKIKDRGESNGKTTA